MTVLNITNNREYQHVLNSNAYIVVIFSAKFCKPCCEFYPSMVELSETYRDIKFIKVDIQECDDVDDIDNIVTIPHFKFIKNKHELFSFSGANKPIIIDTIKKLLKDGEE